MYSDRFSAFLDGLNRITILIPLNYRDNVTPIFTIYFEGQRIGVLKVEEVIKIEHYIKYICKAPFEIPLGEEYQIEDDKGIAFGLRTGAVIRTPEFDDHYYYDGEDLWAVYTKEKTVFVVLNK